MSEPEKKNQVSAPEDDDLDELLDEFDEQVLSQPPGAAADTTDTGEIPRRGELKHNIDELVKDLKIEDPDAKKQFESLVKQFEQTHLEEAAKALLPQNFDNVMRETMERLKKSGETVDEQLKNDTLSGNPEDMISLLLAGLGGAEGDGDFDMTKLLTDMLEQLSLKEVLYEPIKDLNTKFPDFLKDSKEKLSADDYDRYSKQYDITKDILAVFEGPGYDNDNVQHREKVNGLLESLQELGNPPTELVGDDSDFPGFGGLAGKDAGLDFNSKDLPENFEKDLEEGCKQT